MKIAIDISQIPYETGVSVYTMNLVRNLLKIDRENEYILFGGYLRRKKDLTDFASALNGNFSLKTFPLPPILADKLWNGLHILNIEKLIGIIDVFHSSDWTQPPTYAYKVTTVHDLIPLKFPKITPGRLINTHKNRLRWVAAEVDKIIVPSETTRRDLIDSGFHSEKIVVISEAPDPVFKPSNPDQILKLKHKYRIPNEYLLAVGMNPRKNSERIIAAYEKVKIHHKNLKLVILGYPYSMIDLPRGVYSPGHVSREELCLFYSGALAFVYPSLYEGFGLPILEAYACETPVVTSNLGSMKEVAGNGAFLVDPTDVDSIRIGIENVIRNRTKYIEKGRGVLKKNNWEDIARSTLKIYEQK